jgi:hypothetical protein
MAVYDEEKGMIGAWLQREKLKALEGYARRTST